MIGQLLGPPPWRSSLSTHVLFLNLDNFTPSTQPRRPFKSNHDPCPLPLLLLLVSPQGMRCRSFLLNLFTLTSEMLMLVGHSGTSSLVQTGVCVRLVLSLRLWRAGGVCVVFLGCASQPSALLQTSGPARGPPSVTFFSESLSDLPTSDWSVSEQGPQFSWNSTLSFECCRFQISHLSSPACLLAQLDCLRLVCCLFLVSSFATLRHSKARISPVWHESDQDGHPSARILPRSPPLFSTWTFSEHFAKGSGTHSFTQFIHSVTHSFDRSIQTGSASRRL